MDSIAPQVRDALRTLVLSENPFPDEEERKSLIEESIFTAAMNVIHDIGQSCCFPSSKN